MYTFQKTVTCVRKTLMLIALMIFLTSCKQELYSNLSEIEANEMLSILLRNGVDANKNPRADGTLSISIDNESIPLAVSLLQQQGLPRQAHANMGEIFKKEGLISSPLEEKVRYLYALSESIAATLEEIDGVITAKVHIVLPDNNAFSETVAPSSASIYIKYNPIFELDDDAGKIKMIVEKSVSGLSYDKISLVMLPAKNNTESIRISQDELSKKSNYTWVWVLSILGILSLVSGLIWWIGGRDEEQKTAAFNSAPFDRLKTLTEIDGQAIEDA